MVIIREVAYVRRGRTAGRNDFWVLHEMKDSCIIANVVTSLIRSGPDFGYSAPIFILRRKK